MVVWQKEKKRRTFQSEAGILLGDGGRHGVAYLSVKRSTQKSLSPNQRRLSTAYPETTVNHPSAYIRTHGPPDLEGLISPSKDRLTRCPTRRKRQRAGQRQISQGLRSFIVQ